MGESEVKLEALSDEELSGVMKKVVTELAIRQAMADPDSTKVQNMTARLANHAAILLNAEINPLGSRAEIWLYPLVEWRGFEQG